MEKPVNTTLIKLFIQSAKSAKGASWINVTVVCAAREEEGMDRGINIYYICTFIARH